MSDNRGHGSGVRTALVIGGGVAGPVTALALRKAGVAATVYEAYPSAADGVGAWLGLAPNGQAALATVGADAAVTAVGQPVPGMVMADGLGNQLAGFGGFSELPATMTLPRDRLFRALTDHAVTAGFASRTASGWSPPRRRARASPPTSPTGPPRPPTS
ncbi:FAD-dependent monooxygenase [Streptomyces lydicamycinicus]|uniref:FAD-dependent oxidoreductase n=1 Tax=Streptomyces lydicamycinicus TaxID=1546107 RepID=UPI002034EE44|nr:FAD-dependent monooxygenase [Streptomyces lydicamycinicus]USA02396.1 FAD-dependent monooxygenase [Streptomyces lydicamycinicus]